MDVENLRMTMLQSILAQGVPMHQAIHDAQAAVAYVLRGLEAPALDEPAPKTRRDNILDAWAAGETARSIASRLGLKRTTVAKVVCEARKTGEPRAVRRTAHSPEHLAFLAAHGRRIGGSNRKDRQ